MLGGGSYTSLCKNCLCHRLHEELLFKWGTDSSSSPNPFLNTTTSIHSAPNLSICLNFSLPLTSTFSHQALSVPLLICLNPSTSLHSLCPGVTISHLNYAAGPSLLSPTQAVLHTVAKGKILKHIPSPSSQHLAQDLPL